MTNPILSWSQYSLIHIFTLSVFMELENSKWPPLNLNDIRTQACTDGHRIILLCGKYQSDALVIDTRDTDVLFLLIAIPQDVTFICKCRKITIYVVIIMHGC